MHKCDHIWAYKQDKINVTGVEDNFPHYVPGMKYRYCIKCGIEKESND